MSVKRIVALIVEQGHGDYFAVNLWRAVEKDRMFAGTRGHRHSLRRFYSRFDCTGSRSSSRPTCCPLRCKGFVDFVNHNRMNCKVPKDNWM
jgi:hypothetical protein